MAAVASRARITDAFRARLAATGLSDAALAAAIGVTPQFYSQVKTGKCGPSAGYMAGAVTAGLATSFADVAEVIPVATGTTVAAA